MHRIQLKSLNTTTVLANNFKTIWDFLAKPVFLQVFYMKLLHYKLLVPYFMVFIGWLHKHGGLKEILSKYYLLSAIV